MICQRLCCDNCGELLDMSSLDRIINIFLGLNPNPTSTGLTRDFCSHECLDEWLDKEVEKYYERQNSKQSAVESRPKVEGPSSGSGNSGHDNSLGDDLPRMAPHLGSTEPSGTSNQVCISSNSGDSNPQ